MKKIRFPAVLFFTLLLIANTVFSAVLLDRVVATVNNEVITWSELMSVITMEGKQYLSGISDEEKGKRVKELERPFLNSLVETKLQLQEAERLGLSINDAELTRAVDEIKKKYAVSEEVFIRSLEAEGLSFRDYKNRLAEQILLQKTVNYAVRNNVVVSDVEIEEYYEKNKHKFGKDEVTFKIRQILFKLPEDTSQKDSVESRGKEIYSRISKGEDFAGLAREFSEDPSSKFGGDLGFVPLGSVVHEVEDVALSMHPGEVSEPFWSPAGLHIIKLEEKIDGSGFEKKREKIKEILFKEAFESDYHEWRTGLRENAYIEITL